MKCPACESNLIYKPLENLSDTYIWSCADCPIVVFEYYTKADIENLKRKL